MKKALVVLFIIIGLAVCGLYACFRYVFTVLDRSQGILSETAALISAKSKSYRKDHDSVYYTVEMRDGRIAGQKLPADLASFEVLDEDYAKDKNNVFYLDQTIMYADPATFTYLGCGFGKDKQYVYEDGQRVYVEGTANPLITDIDTLNVQENGCVLYDKNYIFTKGKAIPHAQVATFEQLDGDYSKDINNVFYDGKIIPQADPATFEVLNSFELLAKDKDHVFFVDEIIPQADAATFTYLGCGLSKDKQYVFKGMRRVYTGANCKDLLVEDLDSLNTIVKKSGCILYNKNHIYLKVSEWEKACFLPSAQPLDVYTLTDMEKYSRIMRFSDVLVDKNGAYLCDKKLDVDLETFRALGSYKFADKNGIYESRDCALIPEGSVSSTLPASL